MRRATSTDCLPVILCTIFSRTRCARSNRSSSYVATVYSYQPSVDALLLLALPASL